MKIVKWFFISLVVLVVLVGLYFIYGVARFRDGEVKDLGVKYSYKDYTTALEKAGVVVEDPSALSLGSEFTTEGTVRVEQEFTNSEVSALQNISNEVSGPYKDVQIAFHSDGNIEASAMVTEPQINAPVYVKGRVERTGNKTFKITTSKIVAGKYAVPTLAQPYIDQRFENYINGVLQKISGLDVEKIEIKEGRAKFVGTVPAKIN